MRCFFVSNSKFCLSLVITLILLSQQAFGAVLYNVSDSSQVMMLADRMRKDFIAGIDNPTHYDSIQYPVNGSWADINYKDRSASGWQPGKHWDRIIEMAKRYATDSNHLDRRKTKEYIEQAITFWLKVKPTSGNYWWNAIGAPLKMGQVLIMLDGSLSKETESQVIDLMGLGIKENYYDYYGSATGQNQVWLATVHLMIGVVERDHKIIKRAFNAFHNEIFLSDKEGIQFDYSFHQHGSQLYSGGYGMGYTKELARLIFLAHGTIWQFPAEKISLFSSFILEGQQWMAYKNVFDYSTLGREISRVKGADDRVKTLITICDQMAALDIPRKQDFAIATKRLSGELLEESMNKHFWQSDFMVHHTPSYYTSIKMASNRLKASESGNGENLRAYYLGHGVQFILRHGNEYKQIFPLWNWQRLPGHLAVQQETQPKSSGLWGADSQGKKPFTGGVSNGKQGLAVTDYEKDSVLAKRAWFCFDNEIVVMGAGINSIFDRSLFHSVNQCYQFGSIVINAGRNKSTIHQNITSDTKVEGVNWVQHDSVAYYFLDKVNVNLDAGSKRGSWKDINSSLDSPAGILERNIFNLAIDLGKSVDDASFSYAIVPGISSQDAEKYTLPFRVIQNTKLVQAVRNTKSKTLMASFYSASTLDDKTDKLKLTVNRGLLMILRENEKNLELSISCPTNETGEVVLQINKKLKGKGCVWSTALKTTAITIKLPEGGYAGQTVDQKFLIE